jgi:uncharacterized protein (TIGR01777 family)
MPHALVTGATGLVGRHLLPHLAQPVVVSRRPETAAVAMPEATLRRWDPEREPLSASALAGVETVFHLAGEPVAEGRWSDDKRRRIRDSRVLGTRHLVDGLAHAERRPAVLVSASAVGYYGDRGDDELTEDAAPGEGFLAEVCAGWEHEARRAESLGVRVVCVRIGIVLAPDGGALATMRLPFKLGIGGRLGSGRQWMPWIHIDDLVGLLLFAAREPSLHGTLNAAAPGCVRNVDFTRTMGRALHRPAVLPVPEFALRTLFGDMSGILLASQRVKPAAAEQEGFHFAYPELEPALNDALAAGGAP